MAQAAENGARVSREPRKPVGAQPRLRLHQDGPFVMPSKRGIDASAPDFDPEAFLDMLGEDVMFIQHQVLREVLEIQGDAEYLRRHGLNGRTDVESFRRCVPVVSYGDLEADIMKLVNGEKQSIFTVDPVSHFHFSTGTTGGKPKYIPIPARVFEADFFGSHPFLGALHRRMTPGGIKTGKSPELAFAFAGKQQVTPSGIKAGAMTTNYYRSPMFLNRYKGPHGDATVPDEAVLCADTTQGMYCHLLWALARAPEIGSVSAVFAATVVSGARALQKRWPELVHDIRTGTVSETVTDRELRAAMEKTMNPNPALASTIERECRSLQSSNWEAAFARLFPNAQFVECILTGTMQQYVPAVKHFAGRLPAVSGMYAASESGLIGRNPDMACAPEDITYALWPEKNYFEFLPLDAPDAQVLEAGDLQVGKEYELLITNLAGFYRYRLGDAVRVTSLRNTLPVVKFVKRVDVVLSVFDDKTDEHELQIVVDKVAACLRGTTGVEVSDYTSTTEVPSSSPGRYVIFWEVLDSSGSGSGRDLSGVFQECANSLDASVMNACYRRGRYNGFIGPLELRVVREGTVDTMKSAAVARGASPSQFKTPRCVQHPDGLRVLREGTVGSFVSTRAIESPDHPNAPTSLHHTDRHRNL